MEFCTLVYGIVGEHATPPLEVLLCSALLHSCSDFSLPMLCCLESHLGGKKIGCLLHCMAAS